MASSRRGFGPPSFCRSLIFVRRARSGDDEGKKYHRHSYGLPCESSGWGSSRRGAVTTSDGGIGNLSRLAESARWFGSAVDAEILIAAAALAFDVCSDRSPASVEKWKMLFISVNPSTATATSSRSVAKRQDRIR